MAADEDGRPVVVVVRGQCRPHEVMLMAFSVVFSVAPLVGFPLPASLSATVRGAVIGFFVLSGIGGATGLLSVLLRRLPVPTALRLEQGANLLIAAGGVLYVYAIVSLSGVRSWLVVLLIGSVWIAGSIWRATQLNLQLREIRRGRQ